MDNAEVAGVAKIEGTGLGKSGGCPGFGSCKGILESCKNSGLIGRGLGVGSLPKGVWIPCILSTVFTCLGPNTPPRVETFEGDASGCNKPVGVCPYKFGPAIGLILDKLLSF